MSERPPCRQFDYPWRDDDANDMMDEWSYSRTKIHFRFIFYIFFEKYLKKFLSRAYNAVYVFDLLNAKSDPKYFDGQPLHRDHFPNATPSTHHHFYILIPSPAIAYAFM